MTGPSRSRRDEICRLRHDLRGRGATWRHIAQVVAARWKVNARVAFRYAHGLTQQQVADKWNELWPSEQPMTAKQVSYWEAWPSPTGRGPSPDTLNKLARIYQCRAADLLDGEDHSGLDPATVQTVTGRSPVDKVTQTGHAEPADVVSRVDQFIAASGSLLATREQDYQRLVSELVEWACRMKRRDILQWVSWAAASAAAAPVLDGLDDDERVRTATALAEPRRVDDKVIDNIEAVLWRCMRQDDVLGPQAALDTTLAQRRLVRGLLDQAPSAMLPRLQTAYANFSRFAGWLSFDLGNYTAASDYYESARAAAHDAQNSELASFVLCSMSHLAAWGGQPRTGIDHAVAAQVWANRTENHRLRAYAADIAARAYARDGQLHATESSISQAREELSRAQQPSADSFVYFYDEPLLASTEGLSYLRLGLFGKAADVGEQATRAMDPSYVRNFAFTSLYVGASRLRARQRDLDGAVEPIRRAAQLASHNRSTRLVKSLSGVWRELEPFQAHGPVRELREEMATIYSLAA